MSWKKFNIFKHGEMLNSDYALQVFMHHVERMNLEKKLDGLVALEIGPGDSLFSAIIGRSLGVSETFLLDAGDFAETNLEKYYNLIELLAKKDTYNISGLSGANSIQDLLHRCRATYLTNGLESIKTIPNESMDFIWSQAVLEHIRLKEFPTYCREMRRILRAGGICSHRVDLKDHLGGALNNLRFSKGIWESEFMAKSGFYTNRIRYSEMLQMFLDAGFFVNRVIVDRWKCLPTSQKAMSDEFRHLSGSELCVSGFDVILRPKL